MEETNKINIWKSCEVNVKASQTKMYRLNMTQIDRTLFVSILASQAGDADSSRVPGLTSGLQGSVNVHRGALLLVSRWQRISSFVFYISRRKAARACTVTLYQSKVATPGVFKNPAYSSRLCYDWLSVVVSLDTDVYFTRWKFQLNRNPL